MAETERRPRAARDRAAGDRRMAAEDRSTKDTMATGDQPGNSPGNGTRDQPGNSPGNGTGKAAAVQVPARDQAEAGRLVARPGCTPGNALLLISSFLVVAAILAQFTPHARNRALEDLWP